MARIKYEFELKKVVRLIPQMGPAITVGEVEEYFETPAVAPKGDDPSIPAKVKVIVKLYDNLKPQHLDAIVKNPGMLSITGISQNVSGVVVLPQ